LVCGPAFYAICFGSEVAFLGLERFPSVGECVADVDEGGVKVGFGGKAGGKKPFVPVEGGEEVGGFGVGSEEGEEGFFELEGVEGFAGEGGEVL